MENKLYISHKFTSKEIKLIKRLPSVKERKINFDILLKNNTPVILRSENDKLLTIAFYFHSNNYIYTHTTIGKDIYKDIFFKKIFDITTKIAPVYSIFFNSSISIETANRYGAKKINLDNINISADIFISDINTMTGDYFYKQNNIILNHKDKISIENPLYLITRENYLNSLKTSENKNE
jgi:hypothetical protein